MNYITVILKSVMQIFNVLYLLSVDSENSFADIMYMPGSFSKF